LNGFALSVAIALLAAMLVFISVVLGDTLVAALALGLGDRLHAFSSAIDFSAVEGPAGLTLASLAADVGVGACQLRRIVVVVIILIISVVATVTATASASTSTTAVV